MIPLVYRLRKNVVFEVHGNDHYVISSVPLNLVHVSARAVQVLRLFDGERTVHRIAAEIRCIEEHRVFRICDYFSKRGVLEVEQAENGGYFPSVTIIIPVKNRKLELAACLQSVFSQDYPRDNLEVIVIDDGSQDGVRDLTSLFLCRVISLKESRGQSYCRNLGAREASGELLAFIDSDCVAEPSWLKELVGYFLWDRIGGVGGLVDGYYEKSPLDRYEKKFSSLNMGKYFYCAGDENSMFYVPTCNLLVRKKAYLQTGGFRDDMHLAEDVDFCWRMRGKGHYLLYVPSGSVKHRHRNGHASMLKRRIEYGTSEALLNTAHPEKKKVFHLPFLTVLSLLALCAVVVLHSVMPLTIAVGCFCLEAFSKVRRANRLNLRIPMSQILISTIRTYLSCAYRFFFHAVRYYLLLFFAAGFFFHQIWYLSLSMLITVSLIEYLTKKPVLLYPSLLFYYSLDHLSYQFGVILGCLRERSFGCYRLKFMRRTSPDF